MAYNSIIVISLVYTLPFLAEERARGNSNGKIVRHRLAWLAMKLVVAQFCRVMDHESMKVQSVWSQKKGSSFRTACHRTANRFVGVSLASR